MIKLSQLFPCLCLGVVGLFFGACETFNTGGYTRTEYLQPYGGVMQGGPETFDNVSFWDGDGVTGSPRIHIDLREQRAYFYKGNQLVGVSLISSGREGYRTPSGNFKIIQKNANHRSNLYGDYVDAAGNVVKKDVGIKRDPQPPGTRFLGAEMPYFLRIHGGVGMHAGFLPGYPASHGCIRLPKQMAQIFFNNVTYGTPVTVTN